MKWRSIPATILLLVCFAAEALGQSPTPSRMEDLVERFATIVERWRPDDIEPWAPPGWREELLRLNPGRERDVDQLVRRTTGCVGLQMAEAMPRAMRSAARAMGEERLARLVAFLEGPGGAALERSLEDARTPMPDAVAGEWDRLRPDYGRFMYSIPNYVDSVSVSQMSRCYEEESETAARLGLRLE